MTIKKFMEKCELVIHRHCQETGEQEKEGFSYVTTLYQIALVNTYAELKQKTDVQFSFFYYYNYGEIDIHLIY